MQENGKGASPIKVLINSCGKTGLQTEHKMMYPSYLHDPFRANTSARPDLR